MRRFLKAFAKTSLMLVSSFLCALALCAIEYMIGPVYAIALCWLLCFIFLFVIYYKEEKKNERDYD